MRYRVVFHTPIRTALLPVASKSVAARALVLQALSGEGEGRLHHLPEADDTRVLHRALTAPIPTMNLGGAGTAMRFVTACCALWPGVWTLRGNDRMHQRPIAPLVEALRCLGADITYLGAAGCPPLRIVGGQLHGGQVEVDGSMSSQYVSALLMIAPLLEGGLTLRLQGVPASRPYIEMTVAVMREFGAEAVWTDTATLQIPAATYHTPDYTIESDWSAASYWYEIVALTRDAEVVLKGLRSDSLQGDRAVRTYFEQLGVATREEADGLHLVQTHSVTEYFMADMAATPDLVPAIAVTCALKGVPFRLSGVANLRVKETDRLQALCNEMARLGVTLLCPDADTLLCDTTSAPTTEGCPRMATYGDHRMAMALAPAALVRGSVEIEDPEVVNKSYPDYWDHLARIATLTPIH